VLKTHYKQRFLGVCVAAIAASLSSMNVAAPVQQPARVHGSAVTPALHATTHTVNPAKKPVHYQKIGPTRPVKKHNQAKYIWNYHDADIRAVIASIAQLTGKTFLVDSTINGKVSIMSKKPMTVTELYQVFLSMLQSLNYTAVHQGLVTRIVPLTDAKQYASDFSKAKARALHLNQQVVIAVIPVQHVSALQLVTTLQPLMPPSGLITAYNPSNSIVLSGTAQSVHRLTGLIKNLDDQSSTKLAQVKLQHATAKDLVKLLQDLQKNDQTEGKVNTVSYAADDNTNTILVSGSAQNLVQAKALIKKLDQGSANVNSGLTVIHLHYVSATTIVPILAKLAGGNVTSTSGGSNESANMGSSMSQGIGNNNSNSSGGFGNNNSMDNNSDGSSGFNNSGGSGSGFGGGSSIGSDTSSIFQTQQVVSGGGKNFSLVAVPATNNIIVTAPALMVKRIKKIVKLLDVRPKQVLVQALIVRIDESLLADLGIQWGKLGADGKVAMGTGFIRNLSFKGLWTALNTNKSSDVLATPSVVVQNNQMATISDGENIPLPNGQVGGSALDPGQVQTTYTRQNIVLSLQVRPQINSNNSVALTIAQQDNEVQDSTDSDTANPGGPIIDTSTIMTSVVVPNQDILVLGGLLRKTRSENKKGLPILSDIPLLGRLFEISNANHEKSNLLIFLKPLVLNSKKDAQKISHEQYLGMRNDQLKQSGKDSARYADLQPVLPRVKNMPTVHIPQPFATHGR
jgi:general secretion pathway protein D